MTPVQEAETPGMTPAQEAETPGMTPVQEAETPGMTLYYRDCNSLEGHYSVSN